jgi:hypothetical protein
MGDDNKQMAENAFELHDSATTTGRIGRVRQTITADQLISQVDLQVGLLPGIPVRVEGTVVTSATLRVVSPETYETQVQTTLVKGSNIPLFNQFLDDLKFELPVGDFYKTIQGKVPVVSFQTFYVDDALRITRDVDDNFFVFTRA